MQRVNEEESKKGEWQIWHEESRDRSSVSNFIEGVSGLWLLTVVAQHYRAASDINNCNERAEQL